MSSIMTNVSAMTASAVAEPDEQATSKSPRRRISTGYKVATPPTMPPTGRSPPRCARTTRRSRPCRTRSASAPPRSTSPTPASTAAIDVVDEIKTKLVAAREPGVDKSQDPVEIAALQAAADQQCRGGCHSPARTGSRSIPAPRPTAPPSRSSPPSPAPRTARCRSAPSTSTSPPPSCSMPPTSRAFSTRRSPRPAPAP